MDLDWAFQLKNGVPQLNRQSLIPGGSVELSHENLFGDSQSLSVSLSASDWRFPSQDLGYQLSYTEPFYKPNTTRNLQVSRVHQAKNFLLRQFINFLSRTWPSLQPIAVHFGMLSYLGLGRVSG